MSKLLFANRSLALVIMLVTVMMFGQAAILAGEHPEHPKSKEHPEHPEEAIKVDIEVMAAAITEYVENDMKLKGGYFFVYDPVSKKPLQLTLSKVHKERLAQVGENLYFACSDFNADGGKVYDLDFFMEAQEHKLVVTEVMIHKEDGTPRYSWYEEDGVWKRK
jgi:hypothetical protein